jgi:hypothetical protein
LKAVYTLLIDIYFGDLYKAALSFISFGEITLCGRFVLTLFQVLFVKVELRLPFTSFSAAFCPSMIVLVA